MYAVITYPRSGSRSLAKKLSLETGNPIGYLHHAKFVPSYCLTYEQLTAQQWTLHAHWHTVNMLGKQYKTFIESHYKIVHIERNVEHMMLSSVITMTTGNIDFAEEDVPEKIDVNLVDEFVKSLNTAKLNMIDWRIDLCYNFDELYNNTSELNFQRNKKHVSNYYKLKQRLLQVYG